MTEQVEQVDARAFTIPTDAPESDGTFAWTSTTIVVVEVRTGGQTGLGYTYGPKAIASVIQHELGDMICGTDPLSPERTWETMHATMRNAGQSGIGAMAIAAVDIALHDLRARLVGISLAVALGAVRNDVPIYGSGGFTSYSDEQLSRQLGGWVAQDITRVKIKVGRHPEQDLHRLEVARNAVGSNVELMVDANGAFFPAQASRWAELYDEFDVGWLEEPVTQDDPGGLRRVREQAPPSVAIASGEYCWGRYGVQRLLDAEAVDVVQADVTRCCGITELARIDALCGATNRPLSLHCAPAISAHVGCSLNQLIHLEYFHDHVRIEQLLFSGTLSPVNSALTPDPGQLGHGLKLRRDEAERYAVS